MKVIFLQNVAKVGQIGEIKEVSTGYAMNVLIPKKYAVIATDAEIKKIEQEKKDKENKKTLEKSLFLQAVKALEESLSKKNIKELEILGHKHDAGKLFSAVTAQDVVDAIFREIKISFNPSQVIMPKEPIKSHGVYEVTLKDKENERMVRIVIR